MEEEPRVEESSRAVSADDDGDFIIVEELRAEGIAKSTAQTIVVVVHQKRRFRREDSGEISSGRRPRYGPGGTDRSGRAGPGRQACVQSLRSRSSSRTMTRRMVMMVSTRITRKYQGFKINR